MNWYKKIQPIKNVIYSQEVRLPRADETIYQYYQGEDEPVNIREQKQNEDERVKRDYFEDIIRYKTRRKIFLYEEEIKALQKQLRNPNLSSMQRDKIEKQIRVYYNKITKIRNSVPKPAIPKPIP
jgi:hypothetical protein